MLKKSISVLLAVMMLLTLVPMSALQTFAAEDTGAVADGDELTISAGETKTVEITEGGQNVDFKFTPTESRRYVFYSTGSNDTYGYLLDENKYELTHNDDSTDRNFRIEYDCEAGSTYYIRVRFYNSGTTGSFSLVCESIPDAESISILQGDTYTGYAGTDKTLDVSFAPENAQIENLSWSSSNENIATVSDGYVSLLSAGTATITATSERGLTDSITVTVLDNPELTLGNSLDVDLLDSNTSLLMYFEPDSDGIYDFSAYDEFAENDICMNLFDDSMNYLVGKSHSYNPVIREQLTGGNRYYILIEGYESESSSISVSVSKASAATGMEIKSNGSFTGPVGNSISLYAEFTPSGAIEEDVTWSSSDTNVATVNYNGTVSLLAVGTATITATSENGLTDTCEITVTDTPSITPGDTISINITTGGQSFDFKFTPTETRAYKFYSTGSCDTYGYLLDQNRSELTRNDDSDDSNFKITYTCTAGVTYYIRTRLYGSNSTGSYDLVCEAVPFAESVSISAPKTSGYENTTLYLECSFSPAGASSEDVTWSSQNTSVATVDNYGNVSLISPGTATITVTSGLTDSVEITVLEIENLTLDQPETIPAVIDSEVLFRFTAPETREYRFYSTGGVQVNGFLYNSNMSTVAYQYGYNNFDFTYIMQQGQVYYFKTRVNYDNDEENFEICVTATPLAQSVSIDQGDSFTVYMHSQAKLSASFGPEGTYDQVSGWSSSDTSVATVDDFGNITPAAPGNATITVTSANGLTDTIAVTVSGPKELTPGVTDSYFHDEYGSDIIYSFVAEQNGYYEFTVEGADSNRWVNIHLYDANFNNVEEAGGYTANLRTNLNAGTYYVKASFSSSYYSGTLKTTGRYMPTATGITIREGSEITMVRDREILLHADSVPEGAYLQNVTWTSSDESVVSIYSGSDYTNKYIYAQGIGEATITATSGDFTATCTVTVEDYPDIAAGDTKTVEIEKNDEYVIYKFVPTVTGTYSFSSTNSERTYTYGKLMDSDMNTLEYNIAYQFGFNYYCTAGTTYYFSARYYYTDATGSFDVTVTKLQDATALTIDSGDVSGHIGDSMQLTATLYPEGSAVQEITWSSDDNEVAEVSWGGYLSLKSPGTATITASTENGLTDTIEVTVNDFPTISLGESKSVVFGEDHNVETYCFTPESTTACEFTVSSNMSGFDLYIYDSDLNTLTYNYSKKLQYKFEEGKKYYFRVYYGGYDDTTATLTLSELQTATAMSFKQGSTMTAYPHTSIYLSTEYTPAGAYQEPITSWTSSNESVAQVDDYGWVSIYTTGTATITATTENGLTATCVITVSDPIPIEVGDTKTAQYSFSGQSVMYAFTAEADGYYTLSASGNDEENHDTYLTYYDSSFNDISSSYYSISTNMTAGETCYFAVKNNSDTPGPLSVTLTSIPYAESIAFAVGNSLSGHIGDSVYLSVLTTPEEAAPENISWTTTDSSVAYVNNYGTLFMYAIGTATITATTERGLTATCEVTVSDYEDIEPGDTKTVNIHAQYGSETYRFVPEHTGYYAFYSSGDYDTYGELLDEDMNALDSYDQGGENNNFRICKFLREGETYYFKAKMWNADTGSFDVTLEETFGATSIEILTLPDKTEYVEGYVYNYIDFTGLSARITWSDGETTDWTYGTGKSRGEYVYIHTRSSDPTWVGVSCGDAETSFRVTEIESPYESIEVVSGLTEPLIENLDGYWSTNDDGRYFHYYTPSLDDVVLRVNYKDPSRESVEVNYNQKVDGYSIGFNSDQYGDPWTVGGDNSITFYFVDVSTTLPVVIAPNPVESIELVSESENELIENYAGWTDERTNPDTQERENFFCYNVETDDFSDAVIQINYSDGTSETASPGDNVGGRYVEIDHYNSQCENPWMVGGDNVYYITYMGLRTAAHATVVPDPVDHIELSNSPELIAYENYYGYRSTRWDQDAHDYVDYFNYYLDPFEDDLEFTIYFTDGTTAEASAGDTIRGFNLYLSSNQYSVPWTIGENTFTANYLNHSVDIPVTLVENPVDSLTVISPTEYKYVENTHGRWRERWDPEQDEDVAYYYYDNNYIYSANDTVVQINFKDGTSETAKAGDKVGDYWIELNSNQERHPWTVGGSNEAIVSYMGVEATMNVAVIENPVAGLEIVTPSSYVFTENMGGYWSSVYIGNEWQYDYYQYDLDELDDITVRINYKDGTSETAHAGDTVNGYGVEVYADFANDQWTVGSDNIVTVSYLGAEAAMNVTVQESPVESLVVISPPTHQFIENCDGEMDMRYNRDTDEYESYFRYYTNYSYFSDLEVQINFRDGTSTTAFAGDIVNGYDVELNINQDAHPWTLGNNEIEVEYMGKTATTYATVIETPVAGISVPEGAAINLIENCDGYWEYLYNPATDEYDREFFYYECYNQLVEIPVQISFKDGTTVTSYINQNVGGHRVSFDADQYDNPWTVGSDNYLTVTYLGAETQVPVIISPSPVASITVTKEPEAEIYENCNGYWATNYNPVTDEYDRDYFHYDLPYINDATILITYVDGTTKTANLGDTVDGYPVDWTTNQRENPWTVGGANEVTVRYMGKAATFSMTILPNPVASVTVTRSPTRQYILGEYSYFSGEYFYPTDLTGLAFTVLYKDGTSKSFTADDIDKTNGTIDGFKYTVEHTRDYAVGNNDITFTYMDHDATFNATIIDSPVSGIEVINGPTDPSVTQYKRPDPNGTTLKVTFNNGQTQTITLSDDNITYANDGNMYGSVASFTLNGYEGTIPLSYWDSDDPNYFYTKLFYAGKTCEIPVTVTRESPVESIDVENFSTTGENMVIKTFRRDGTQVDYTVQKILYYQAPQGARIAQVLARTDKGIITMNIKVDPEYTYYDVYAFNCRYKKDKVRLLGDTNGDNVVTIDDATLIQRYLAEYRINDLQQLIVTADVDGNNKISISDVTAIQRYLAEIETPAGIGEPIA